MKLVLIGGGSIGRGSTLYETEAIDMEIVKMAKNKHPILLFIGLASKYSDSYYDTIKRNFNKLNCKTMYLKKSNIVNNPDIVKDKFSTCDIIYICAGDTIRLLELLNNYGLVKYLIAAADRDCVLVGNSAGAICLSKSGLTDSYILRGEDNKYSFVDGLGFYSNVICPHYNDQSRKEQLNELSNLKPFHIIGIDECAALKIDGTSISSISSKNESHVHDLTYKNGMLVKDDII